MATQKGSSGDSELPSSVTLSTIKSGTARIWKNSNRYIFFITKFLEDTDYGSYLLTDNPNISVALMRSKLKKKLADEIEYTCCNSTGMLVEFLDMLSIRYQIDNVVNVIEGLKNKVDIDVLINNADPLGYFPEIRNIKVLEGDDYSGLYRDVLIDTPVGPYFMKFLEEEMVREGGESRTMQEVQNIFKELKP